VVLWNQASIYNGYLLFMVNISV